MIHSEYYWNSRENKKVFAQSWVPDGEITGIINLVHGLGEHSGRYARWASLFAAKGWGVLTMDLTGHGKSEGKRGHIKNYRELMNQLDLLLQKSEELFPGKPRILYGHSMGGNLAVNYVISRDVPILALISSSPWLKLAFPVSPSLMAVTKLMNLLLPGLGIKWPKNPENLSRDPEIVEDVKNDPLNHGYITPRMSMEVYKHGLHALKHVYRINRPFLMMHGSGDKVTSHTASIDFVTNTSERTQLKIWDGLYHELHNEIEYQEVFNYVYQWISELK